MCRPSLTPIDGSDLITEVGEGGGEILQHYILYTAIFLKSVVENSYNFEQKYTCLTSYFCSLSLGI